LTPDLDPRPHLPELVGGLHGALQLARGRAEGIAWLPTTAAGAARSFWAAALCLPVFLLMRLLLDGAALTSPRAAAAELLGYTLGWVVFALAALPMTERMGRAALWPRLVATWNWVNLLQYAILLALTLLSRLLLPDWLQEAVSISGVGYALWLQWFAARTALGVPGLQAVGLVALDLGLSMFLSGLVTNLSGS
jgi:hypothetical protein